MPSWRGFGQIYILLGITNLEAQETPVAAVMVLSRASPRGTKERRGRPQTV
jgi:hypothetical protein